MTSVVDTKVVGSSFSNQVDLIRAVYDFDADGGSLGDLTLLTSDGGCVVKLKYMRVVTAVTSAGALTLDLGKASGAELLSAVGKAALVVDLIHLPSAPAAVELTDGEVVAMGIIAAAATAGKMEFVFEVMKR